MAEDDCGRLGEVRGAASVDYVAQPDGSTTCTLLRADGLPMDYMPDAAMAAPALPVGIVGAALVAAGIIAAVRRIWRIS